MLSSVRKWAPILLGVILISPLFIFPRPVNISSIPWRVELLFSIFLCLAVVVSFHSNFFRSAASAALEDRRLGAIIALMGGFCIWSALSVIWAPSPASAIHHTLLWANYTVVFVLTVFLASQRSGRTGILHAMAAPAILIFSLAAFDFVTLQDFSMQEGSLRIRYAKFAEMLAVIAPVLFSVAFIARSRGKSIAAVALGSMAWIGVMLSLSKGAFLSGAIGFALLFVCLALFKRQRFRKTLFAAASWLLITVIFQFGTSYLTTVPSTVNYISGSADATRSTSDMRVYTWRVAAEMIRTNPILGVGGDNFGLAFNSSRESLAKAEPHDATSAIGEYYIFERAHNEPVQIFAELGIVGICLFVLFACASLTYLLSAIFRDRERLSPLFFGGIAGMSSFAASSLVSSFSFRAYQNGIVFFMIFGLTCAMAPKRSARATRENAPTVNLPAQFALVAAAMLLTFSTVKAVSQYVLYAAGNSRDLATAIKYFETASRLDPDNPGAELAAAEAFVREEQWGDAVPYFRRAIDRGYGISVVYSDLANAQELSGDLPASETTLKESVSVFPRSSFLRARLVTVLEKLGKFDEAHRQMAIAQSHDDRQTNGWYAVIKDGILNAHLKAKAEPDRVAAPPELRPENAIHAYNTDKVQVD